MQQRLRVGYEKLWKRVDIIMLFVLNFIDNAYRTMNVLKQRLESEIAAAERSKKRGTERTPFDVSSIQTQFNTAFLDLGMALEECRFLSGNVEALENVREIYPSLEARIRNAKNIHDYLSIINLIIDPLKPWIDGQYLYRYDWYDYSRSFRAIWGNAYDDTSADFDTVAIETFRRTIQWQKNRPVTIFNMNCTYNNNVIALMNTPNTNIKLYGLDSHKVLSSTQRAAYTRVVFGGLKGSMISNDTFDIITCLPPLTQNRTIKNNVIMKTEQEMILKAVDYLRPDGVLFMALPYYRYYHTLCVVLARNFKNVQLFTVPSETNKDSHLVYFIGTKCETLPLPEMSLYRKLRGMPLHWKDTLDPYNFTCEPVKLPEGAITVKRFRGSELNEEEIAELFSHSKCTQDFWKDQFVEKLSESKARPLLPFSIGQLGLVLTSGCLDGVVDEGNGYKHIVKGRVIKRVDRYENLDTQTHRIQVESTTSNRVEINAFLANGTYKCLA